MSTFYARALLVISSVSFFVCVADLAIGAPGWMGWVVAALGCVVLFCTQMTTLAHLRMIDRYRVQSEYWKSQAQRSGQALYAEWTHSDRRSGTS